MAVVVADHHHAEGQSERLDRPLSTSLSFTE